MSDFVDIGDGVQTPHEVVWLRVPDYDLRQYLECAKTDSTVLANDENFRQALDHFHGGLILEECSEVVMAELAKMASKGSVMEGPFWTTTGVRPKNIPNLQRDLQALAEAIGRFLSFIHVRRTAQSPKQRLCEILRQRAVCGMRQLLASHGLKPHEFDRIQREAQCGRLPSWIMEFVPMRQWQRRALESNAAKQRRI